MAIESSVPKERAHNRNVPSSGPLKNPKMKVQASSKNTQTDQVIVPSSNFLSEVVLPLLSRTQESTARGEKKKKRTPVYIPLGFGIKLIDGRNEPVYVTQKGDKLRFCYLVSSSSRSDLLPKFESAWSKDLRLQFSTLFERRFPFTNTPILFTRHQMDEEVVEEEAEDVGEKSEGVVEPISTVDSQKTALLWAVKAGLTNVVASVIQSLSERGVDERDEVESGYEYMQ